MMLRTTIALINLAFLGPRPPAPMQTPRDAVDSAEVWVQKTHGRVAIAAHHGPRLVEMMEGWSVPPRVGYRVDENGRAFLNLTDEHRSSSGWWAIMFGDHAVLDLHVWLGEAKARLHLQRLDLRSLDLRQGRGDVDLRLGGARWRDSDVSIQGGRGNMNVWIDGRYAVEVHVDSSPGAGELEVHGLRWYEGRYVNDPVRRAPATIRVNLRLGSGNIDLRAHPHRD